ncbi:MAG TPA: CHAT domain-containing protein [Candidatus Polarisedimenticolaceae bacterium]|nr:CHAT domain-containing protein [Candidatus Polarisedimenticolaceae bacterium]
MRLLIALLLTLLASSTAVAGEVEDALARIEAGDLAGAVQLAERVRDADALQKIAEAFYGVGSSQGEEAALRIFREALALREARAAEEPAPLADLLHDLSGVHYNAGSYAEAEDAEARALAIRSRIYPEGDVRTAESRRDLALCRLAEGRLAEAASELPPALAVIEAATGPEDWLQVAVGRNYLAELYRLQGRYGEAARVLEDLVAQAGEKLGEANPRFPHFLNNLAGIYRDQDRFDEAETLLRRSLALRLAASPRDDGDVAAATLNLAELYRVQGKPAEAEPLYTDALRLARGALPQGSPELLEFVSQKAVLDRAQGRLARAQGEFEEALKLAEAGLSPDHPRVAQTRLDLGGLLADRGRCPEARPHFARALAVREQVFGPEHPDVAEALTAEARCLSPAAARANLDRALSILGTSEAHRASAVEALTRRADLLERTDRQRARQDLEDALRLVETMRPHRGGGEAVRAAFFSRHAGLYARLARAEVDAGRPDRALAVAERGRARALLDQLAAAHVGEGPLDPALAARRTTLTAEMAEIGERLTYERTRKDLEPKARQGRVRVLEEQLDAATRDFRLLYDEIRNADPAWRQVAVEEPAGAEAIQRDAVPEEGLLLLYQVSAEGSLLFVVPPPPAPVEARSLSVPREAAAILGVRAGPLTAEALAKIVARLRPEAPGGTRGIGGLSTSSPSGAAAMIAGLHALWKVLVPAALWPRLATARTVLVLPDGALNLLPFESLVVRAGADAKASRFWLDAGPVLRYAPSATLARDLARRPVPPRASDLALVVSDPAYPSGGPLGRLPGTAREAEAVQDALRGAAEVERLQGNAAREPAVRSALPGKRYLHLATHGLLDPGEGELFAGLALTPPPSPAGGEDDGFLRLHEIYGLRLDADLAVLSACESNAGRVVAGEGVFALSRGFLVAGARRVVASQWPVDDASTASLMGELYREMAAGSDAAFALRDAKRSLRRDRRWADPLFWAPFVLTGAE